MVRRARVAVVVLLAVGAVGRPPLARARSAAPSLAAGDALDGVARMVLPAPTADLVAPRLADVGVPAPARRRLRPRDVRRAVEVPLPRAATPTRRRCPERRRTRGTDEPS